MQSELLELLKILGSTGLIPVLFALWWYERKRVEQVQDARIKDLKWWMEILSTAKITVIRQDADSPTLPTGD